MIGSLEILYNYLIESDILEPSEYREIDRGRTYGLLFIKERDIIIITLRELIILIQPGYKIYLGGNHMCISNSPKEVLDLLMDLILNE